MSVSALDHPLSTEKSFRKLLRTSSSPYDDDANMSTAPYVADRVAIPSNCKLPSHVRELVSGATRYFVVK